MAHEAGQARRAGSSVLARPAMPGIVPVAGRHAGWRGVALVALLIVGTRLLASAIARQTGFLEYNADGYARIIHAAEWSLAPRFEVGVWLPLQFWLTGAALWLWPDLAVTPIAINFTASLVSAGLLAAIGCRLGGQAAGLVTGVLAAAFPWSVWFGLSGLAEAQFAVAVCVAGLGLVDWLQARPAHNVRPTWGLWLAAAGLLTSSMLRYEGWFYALALVSVVLLFATAAERRRPRTLAPLAAPFAFPLLWVGASTLMEGDPFAFARATSDITAAEGTHDNLSRLERLIFYPIFATTLAWPVVGLAASGALWQRRRPGVAGYGLWLVGELAILSLVTAQFSGIGAGRDRYIMSTIVLALPLVGLLVAALWQRAGWGRLAAVAATLLMLGFAGVTLLTRQNLYPAPATVALADRLRIAWERGDLDPEARLPMEVGVPGEDNTLYNESYAVRVLTNRLDAVDPFWDLALFNQVVADRAPSGWISDGRLANPARPTAPSAETIGPYTLYFRPPPPGVVVSSPARAGGPVRVDIRGLQPREWVGVWLTAADGQTIDLGQMRADTAGEVHREVVAPARTPPGRYTLSVRGATTGATGTAGVTVEPAPAGG